MIFTDIGAIGSNLSEFKECINFIKRFNKNPLKNGRYNMSGGGYLSVFEYETKQEDECIAEGHKKYIDVHYIISGKEKVKHAFLNTVSEGEYVEQKDFLPIFGELNTVLTLSAGDLLILYPDDVHKTGIVADKKDRVKKIIFKIPYTEGKEEI